MAKPMSLHIFKNLCTSRNLKGIKNAWSTFNTDEQKHYSKAMLDVVKMQGGLDVLSCLIDLGADVNTADISGNTLLIIASCLNKKKMVKILLDHNAKLDCINCNGYSALSCAQKNQNQEIVDLLTAKAYTNDENYINDIMLQIEKINTEHSINGISSTTESTESKETEAEDTQLLDILHEEYEQMQQEHKQYNVELLNLDSNTTTISEEVESLAQCIENTVILDKLHSKEQQNTCENNVDLCTEQKNEDEAEKDVSEWVLYPPEEKEYVFLYDGI